MRVPAKPIPSTTMKTTSSISDRPAERALLNIACLGGNDHRLAAHIERNAREGTGLPEPIERKARCSERDTSRRGERVSAPRGYLQHRGSATNVGIAKLYIIRADDDKDLAPLRYRLSLRIAHRGLDLLAKPRAVDLRLIEKRHSDRRQYRHDGDGDDELDQGISAIHRFASSCRRISACSFRTAGFSGAKVRASSAHFRRVSSPTGAPSSAPNPISVNTRPTRLAAPNPSHPLPAPNPSPPTPPASSLPPPA